MFDRPDHLKHLATAVSRSPITALLGPRQCGKTTLARMFSTGQAVTWFDLESPADRQRLQNPELMLGMAQGLVVLDEIQALPELFNVLRVLADRTESAARFLILGSASPVLIRKASESLAGRVEFVELNGFDLRETGEEAWRTLWVRGGFPRAFLAASDADSLAWREGFIRTFLERDIPQLGITIPAPAMRRFWTMLAHYHGQYWSAAELARAMGLSDKTVRGYLDLLTGIYMVRQLQPWHENLGKRQVKAPKIYLRDSGVLHGLLNLPDWHSLAAHPKVGASWEGFVIEQVLQVLRPTDAFFWATQNGAELDLLFCHRGRRYGVEVKFNEAPKIARAQHIALSDLGLEHLWIIYPGPHRYPAHDRITMWPVGELVELARELG
ncbi:MAG TPA: ATP-binding protein [Candidatus Contendobacter sp.]|nr:ATP-binding protein [Candidatus Contendobacter sp.]